MTPGIYLRMSFIHVDPCRKHSTLSLDQSLTLQYYPSFV